MKDETLKQQMELLNNKTELLQTIYKRLKMLLKDFFIYVVIFSFINITNKCLDMGESSGVALICTFTALVLLIVLLVYAMMIYKSTIYYKQIFNSGFYIWCQLSDRLDWSSIRRKSLYNISKETNEVLTVMNIFYNEFQKKYSPVATRLNYFKIIIFILSIICIYDLILLFCNIYDLSNM